MPPALKVSVILPVRNEEYFIIQCLDSILANDFPKDQMEVIAIDGNSRDNTLLLLNQYNWQGMKHAILTNPRQIAPVSMNMGIKSSHGKYIIRMDAHTVYKYDYISKCVEYLDQGVADNVGGAMRAKGHGPVSEAIALATSSPFGIGNARFHFAGHEGYVDTVYLGAYKREVFEKIGFFDEELVRNQDDEFNYRLIKSGGKIYLASDIFSEYTPRSSFKNLWTQYFQYGYCKVRVIQKHRMPASLRHLVPGMFVSVLLLSFLFAPWCRTAVISAFTILLAYGAACLVATVAAGRKQNLSTIVLLPVVFGILHFSYGWGFLKGFMIFIMGKNVFSKDD